MVIISRNSKQTNKATPIRRVSYEADNDIINSNIMKTTSKTITTLSKLANSRRLSDLTNIAPEQTNGKRRFSLTSSSSSIDEDLAHEPLITADLQQQERRHNIVEYQPDEYTPLKPEEADEGKLAKLLLEAHDFSSFLFHADKKGIEMDDDATIHTSNLQEECAKRRIRTSLRASQFHRGKSFTRQLSADDEEEENKSSPNKRMRISEE